jgi:hypothetical protein
MYNLETLTTQDEDKRKLKRQSQMYNLETLTTQDEDKQRYKKLNTTQKTEKKNRQEVLLFLMVDNRTQH